jgi:hypothetical protein
MHGVSLDGAQEARTGAKARRELGRCVAGGATLHGLGHDDVCGERAGPVPALDEEVLPLEPQAVTENRMARQREREMAMRMRMGLFGRKRTNVGNSVGRRRVPGVMAPPTDGLTATER